MSHYPDEAFSISGGCRCSSVRYTLAIPALSEWPVSLTAEKSSGQGEIRMPQTAICFCNDCRRSCGSIALFALLAPFHWATLSLDTPSGKVQLGAQEYVDALRDSIEGSTSVHGDSSLAAFRSSHKAMRSFCNKCGTPLFYLYTLPIPAGGTSGGLDVYMGTADQEDLERLGGLDRFVQHRTGIQWIWSLFKKEKGGTPWHPGTIMSILE